MADMVVGSLNCSSLDVVNIIMTCQANSVLNNKWVSLAARLGLGLDVTDPIRDDRLLNKIKTINETLSCIINAWIAAKGNNATLGELVGALRSEGLNSMAGLLEKKYYGQRQQQQAPNDNLTSSPSTTTSFTSDSTPIEITPDEIDFIKNVVPFSVEITKPTSRTTREDKYKLPIRFKGLALLINVIEFDQEEIREGAANDTKYMKELWEGLGYESYDVSGYQGRFTAEDIKKIIHDFNRKVKRIEEEEGGVKSCVAFIGSHGEMGSIGMSSGPSISVYEDFIYKITGIKELEGKPKFIIVNACQLFSRTGNDAKTVTMPEKDTIICFSTIPGHVSKRDIYLGSWYINCLTRVIMKNAHHMHLEDMLKLTQQTMQNIVAETTKGQLPWHTNLLMENLYFNLPLA